MERKCCPLELREFRCLCEMAHRACERHSLACISNMGRPAVLAEFPSLEKYTTPPTYNLNISTNWRFQEIASHAVFRSVTTCGPRATSADGWTEQSREVDHPADTKICNCPSLGRFSTPLSMPVITMRLKSAAGSGRRRCKHLYFYQVGREILTQLRSGKMEALLAP